MKTPRRMSLQNMLTSQQYMEMIIPSSPECIECAIPMMPIYYHGVKGKNPQYFCGHCGIVTPQ